MLAKLTGLEKLREVLGLLAKLTGLEKLSTGTRCCWQKLRD